jgi:hypothetical protein
MFQYLISALIAALLLGGFAPTQATGEGIDVVTAFHSQLQR